MSVPNRVGPALDWIVDNVRMPFAGALIGSLIWLVAVSL